MAIVLPPGVVFLPSEELLLTYYLRGKNRIEGGDFNGAELIRELDLYNHDPFELSEAVSFSFGNGGKFRHWYSFTPKFAEERRMCRTGFWMKKGVVHDIKDGDGNEVLGTKTLFCFYIGNSPRNADRTDWIMYEYALANNPMAPFVVCRIFDSEQGMDLSSCMESISDVVEADADDGDNEVTSQNPLGCAGEQDDRRVATAPCYVGPQDPQQERLDELPGNGDFFMEVGELALFILEEEFIELNDLA